MNIEQRDQLLHMLANSAQVMLTTAEMLRRLPLPVDVEPLMLLRHRTLTLFGKLFIRRDDSNDAELIAAANAIVAEVAEAGSFTLAELKRVIPELKRQHEGTSDHG